MEYKMISKSNTKELGERVNKYLGDGWELYGPPIISSAGMSSTVCIVFGQAMIKTPGLRGPNTR